MIPGWNVVGHLCRSRDLSSLSSVLNLGKAILAMQACWPGHLGIVHLNVVRSIGRLFENGGFSTPLPLAI